MEELENTIIFQEIAESIGLPPLAIEVGFLLLLTALILIIVLVVEAIFKIRKEIIKFRLGADHIASLLTRGIEEFKLNSGVYDFNPGEWRDDTEDKVLRMLQEGKTHDEIKSNLEVSETYIKGVRKWAITNGSLLKKNDTSVLKKGTTNSCSIEQ